MAPGASAALPTVAAPQLDDDGVARGGTVLRLAEDGAAARYIVRLDDPAVATYDGGIAGLAPTMVAAGEQLDAQSAPVRRYEDYLLSQQADVVAAAADEIGRAPALEQQFTHALNGFVAELTTDEARAIAALPDVAAVTVDELRELQTDVGPEWIGAPAIWGQPSGIPADIEGSVFVAAERQRVLGGMTGPSGEPIGAGQTVELDLADAGATVPAGATAVVLNVTAAGATEGTYLSVCPGGTAAAECDDQSNLNPYPGQDVAAQVVVQLGEGDDAGTVDLYNNRGTVGVFADLAGWFVDADSTTEGSLLEPISPTRVMNFQPVDAGEMVTVDLSEAAPEGARAVAINLTGAAVQGDTYVSACAGGTTLEECRTTSVLNLYTGTDAANLTIVELSADDTVSFYSDRADIQLVGDAQGWFVDSALGGSAFQATEPVRVLDGATIGRQGTTTLDLDELGDAVTVPEGTTAVALNLTAAGVTDQTFISACPGGTAATECDNSSVLNPRAGQDRANMVIAQVNPDENTVDFYNNVGDVLLYADLAGFFTQAPGGEIVTDGTQGEGIVAGIIDSGIVPENPSFADRVTIAEGGDGYDHSNPFGAGNYVGVCDPDGGVYIASFPCNDKLIGAWDFTGDQGAGGFSPRDENGHGTHTASTTAGNRVRVTTESLEEPAFVATEVIKGVAPHANVIAYDVCGIPTPDGPLNPGCSLAAIVGAINQAILDEVDVLNYSIGGGSSDPWADPDALAFLSARTAGIFVATSAGNSGPGVSTVGSPGEAPWMTSVGATTHDREWQNTVTAITAADGATFEPIQGKGFSSGTDGALPLVYAGDAPWENPLCLADGFAEGTELDGLIVVCDRGTSGRVQKGQVVEALGAAGMILANDEASAASVNGDPHALPAVNISFEDGRDLKEWMATVEDETAAIAGAVRIQADILGDRQAGFSSRGPNLRSDTMVPSLSAPGVDILAANGTNDTVQWGFISGTSMASPHVAGAGALMTALHPSWGPAEIESALMTTAHTAVTDTDETPADWFDMGAGRVDLTQARDAGLVLSETTTDYLYADPMLGGDTSALNLASMAQSACVVTCTWERVVTATETGVGTWTAEGLGISEGLEITVEPATFTFDRPERTQVLTVTAQVGEAELGQYAFGQVVLTPQEGSVAPAAHLPVSAFSSNAALAPELMISTTEDSGTAQTAPIRSAFDVTDLQAEVTGLVLGTETELSIAQDPTNGNPYDAEGTQTTIVDVPEGATRFVASIADPTAADYDLFVGTGTEPSEDTEVCTSAAGGSLEECDFVPDPEDAGQYWVLVQNWEASDAEEDTGTLVTAVTVEDEGNLTVGDPVPAQPVEAGTEFTVPVSWSGLSTPGTWFATVTLGSSEETPDDIGTFFVTIERTEGEDPVE